MEATGTRAGTGAGGESLIEPRFWNITVLSRSPSTSKARNGLVLYYRNLIFLRNLYRSRD